MPCRLCACAPRCSRCGGKIEPGGHGPLCYGCRIDQLCIDYGRAPLDEMPPTGIGWLDQSPIRSWEMGLRRPPDHHVRTPGAMRRKYHAKRKAMAKT
jgi:hypothetical protein